MNPQERISTILLIEQLKHSKANICLYISYKDIVFRKGDKTKKQYSEKA